MLRFANFVEANTSHTANNNQAMMMMGVVVCVLSYDLKKQQQLL